MPAPPRASSQVKVALPNKGRLADAAVELFDHAGLHVQSQDDRRLFASTPSGDVLFLFVRAQDIPEFVAEGAAHAGITGLDVVAESGLHVEQLVRLGFGRCRLALAVPDASPIADADGLPPGLRVATTFPNLATRFFKERGVPVELVPVSGAAEVTPQLGVADAIVDLVATGSTLAVNKLRELTTLMASEAVLVANPAALQDARLGPRLRELAWVVESVVAARGRRYLMANVPRARLEDARRLVPGISGPTVLNIHERGDMVAIHAVVPESDVFGIVRALKDIGATGILVTSIERLVP